MALIHCDFHSDVLQMYSSMCVILPQTPTSAKRGRLPTLYLLHGRGDDHTSWTRKTSVERHAANTDLAIVMPNAHRSYYTDMARGGRYWTFVSEELPRIARAFFPLSERCEENFVAGFSMGGYGAFKLALRCPEKFAAAASISGVFDLSGKTATENPEEKKEFENIFGDLNKIRGSENDLFKLAENLAKSSGPKRKLYQCCGKSDSLFPQNAQFAKHVKRLGLDFTYEEGPGDHDWGYVDQQIQRILKWLPL